MESYLKLPVSDMELEPDFMAEFPDGLSFGIEGVERNPEHSDWYTHWLILDRYSRVTIGGIGLSGRPDHIGHTQVGYFVDAKRRRQGVATEALGALLDWAFQEPTLTMVVAYTPVANLRSQRVLIHNGFHLAEQEGQDAILKWEKLR